MRFLNHVFLLTICSLPLYAGIPALSLMTESEQKDAGIEKLSPEEKHALDLWLVKVMPKPEIPPVVKKNKLVHGEYLIKETRDFGRYITLENGICYEIPSRSRKKTMAWKLGEKIRVIEPIRPINYKLENIDRDTVIGGKISQPKTAQE